MGLLELLFGNKKKQEKISEMISRGARVIDVRSPGEFNSGHAKGSINIPLNQLGTRIKEVTSLKTPVLVCCASGMRSAIAEELIKKEGVEVMNAGSWNSIKF